MVRLNGPRIVPVPAMVLIASALALAASALAGRWQGETDGGASILLELTVEGADLTGTLTRNGQQAEVADGKVSGRSFTFKATLDNRTDGFSGTLDGDRMKLWLDRQGEAKAIVLTRVKDEKRSSAR